MLVDRKYKCTMSQMAIGDGCDLCNPQYTIELLRQEIKFLKDEISELEAESGLWKTSVATCKMCKHTWIGVSPIGAKWLECPNCSRKSEN